jgi:hypothetical protein
MRRLLTLLVASSLVFGLAVPASGLTDWVVRRQGTQTCDFDKQVKTRITAQENHLHTRVSIGSYEFEFPDNGVTYSSYVSWGWFEMQYKLSTRSGWYWNPSLTYAYCGSL